MRSFTTALVLSVLLAACCPAPVAPVQDQRPARAELMEAKRAFASGADEEALSRLLRCLDAGLGNDRAFGGVWLTDVPDLFGQLAQRFPAASIALRERIGAMEVEVTDGAISEFAQVRMYVALSDVLGDHARPAKALDTLRMRKPRNRAAEIALAFAAFDALATSQRSDLFAAYSEDLLVWTTRGHSCEGRGLPAGMADLNNEVVRERGARLYSALLEVDEISRARALADRVTGLCNDPRAYALVHQYARKVGQTDEAERIVALAGRKLKTESLAQFTSLIQASEPEKESPQ